MSTIKSGHTPELDAPSDNPLNVRVDPENAAAVLFDIPAMRETATRSPLAPKPDPERERKSRERVAAIKALGECGQCGYRGWYEGEDHDEYCTGLDEKGCPHGGRVRAEDQRER